MAQNKSTNSAKLFARRGSFSWQWIVLLKKNVAQMTANTGLKDEIYRGVIAIAKVSKNIEIIFYITSHTPMLHT